MAHIGVSKQAIIGSDNDILPGRRQDIFWTNVIFIQEKAFEYVVRKIVAILSRPQCVYPYCSDIVPMLMLLSIT